MITIISPRIANLGDFANAFPALSGLSKALNQKFHFVICDRLEQFKGIKELLSYQDMFEEVSFVREGKFDPQNCALIDDTGHFENSGNIPLVTTSYANFIRNSYKIQFEVDADFELKVPKLDIDYFDDKVIVGDRWSPKLTNDMDLRRDYEVIEKSGVIKDKPVHYLDYTKDLVYNCALIKYNKNAFITTITGIGIIADLMNKETIVCWDEDMRVWDGKPVEYDFERHYYTDRKSKLVHVKDLEKENELFA